MTSSSNYIPYSEELTSIIKQNEIFCRAQDDLRKSHYCILLISEKNLKTAALPVVGTIHFGSPGAFVLGGASVVLLTAAKEFKKKRGKNFNENKTQQTVM